MNTTTVAGPFNTYEEALATCDYLGGVNHSVFGRAKNKTDEQGVEYTDYDDQTYYVERLNDVTPERIFSMTWDQLNAKQHRQ